MGSSKRKTKKKCNTTVIPSNSKQCGNDKSINGTCFTNCGASKILLFKHLTIYLLCL